MKIGIYSPYLDTLGGGERYILTFAEYCLQRNFKVNLFWKDKEIIKKAEDRFHLKLENIKLNPKAYNSFQADASYALKLYKTLNFPSYDLILFLSDGSIPYLNAKNNWLHFQVPFQLDGSDFKTQKKLSKINRVICNSNFTKKFIDKSFNINSDVLYPPVSIHDFELEEKIEKENIILSVGRFDQTLNAKRQDALIQAFKKLVDEEKIDNWKLCLAGGLKENEDFLLLLREKAINYPIEFFPNIEFEKLVQLYQKSKIYWHATGFEINDDKDPDKVEHFGITIVEAMSTGCIPVVCNKGGVSEIITDKENGYLWDDIDQLVKITSNICQVQQKQAELIDKAEKRSYDFSKETFFQNIDKLLNNENISHNS